MSVPGITEIGRAAVVTMVAARTEYVDGYAVVTGGRIESVGAGPAPAIEGATVVDGGASDESRRPLEQARQAVPIARARGGPREITVRPAVESGTLGGARALGRNTEIGSIEPGKQADVAVWRLDTPARAGGTDPVATLVPRAQPDLLLVGDRTVVRDDRVVTVDEDLVGAQIAAAHDALVAKAG